METNAMEVKNLSFSYGSNQILSDISLTIPRGKITTIMGANGCGKSTLFSLMTKNLTPGKGKILLEEKSIKKYSLSEFARKVSIVHQHNSAAEDITIERLVSYGRTPYQKMLGGKSEEDERLIEQALQVTDFWTCVTVRSEGFQADSDRESGSPWHWHRIPNFCSWMSRPLIWISAISWRSWNWSKN